MIDKIKVQNQVFEINDTALRSKVNLIDEKLSDTSADLELLQTEVESVERISLENSRNIDNIEIELDEKASKEELVDYQHKLTPGQNITIENNVISATGGGSSDYNQLTNKPLINDIELSGNVSGRDLGILDEEDVDKIAKTVMDEAKYNYVKDGLVNNTNTLTDEEKLKIETWLGIPENYLTYYNTIPYQVAGEYNPAHKKYVDEANKALDDKIKDLQLFKFPNMTIVGTPTIQNGQVSGFTLNDYLEFPFLVDFRNRPFEINFAFTTGSNVTVQQNILDSAFGLALAIKNGHTLLAISYNGTTWANQYTGTLAIEPNTTYVYRITWNGILYKVQYFNGSDYADDFTFASNLQPYPKQMFIGVSKLSDNYFEGTINLNYANLKVNGNVVWTGMDDAGLASRMAVDMSNIDEAGVDYLKELIEETATGGGSDAPAINIKLNTSFSEYDNNSDKTSYITNKQEIETQIKKLYDLGCHTFNTYLEFIGSDNANYSMLYQGGQFSKKSLLQKPTSMAFTDFFTSSTDTTSNYYQAFFNSKITLTLTWSEDVPTLTRLQFTSGRFMVPNTTYSLSKTNTTAYIPTSTYHPATKGYVDDATGGIVGEMTSLILDEGFKRKGTEPQPITLSFASDRFTDRGNNVYYYSTTGATINANGTITVTTENDCYLSIHYTAYPDAPFIMYEVDSTSVVRYKDDVPKNVDTIYNYLVPAGTHTIYLTYYKQTGYSGGTKEITLTLPTEGYNVEDFKVASESYVDSKIGEITTVLATLTTPEEG